MSARSAAPVRSPMRAATSGQPRPADLRSPYVLDSRELGRRPGTMRELRREVPAPQDWALPLVTIPADATIRLDLRLESVMEGVLVSGTAAVTVEAECGRCLDATRSTVTAPIQELFAYQPEAGDDDTLVLTGDAIDLEPVLRDAVVLALPLNPLCSPDCPGLCPGCGEQLAGLSADHHHDDVDPRWAALAELTIDPVTDEEN